MLELIKNLKLWNGVRRKKPEPVKTTHLVIAIDYRNAVMYYRAHEIIPTRDRYVYVPENCPDVLYGHRHGSHTLVHLVGAFWQRSDLADVMTIIRSRGYLVTLQ